MKKKVIISIVLFIISGIFVLGSVIVSSVIFEKDVRFSFGGLFSVVKGIITIDILQQPQVIIDSPKNITYNFSIDDFINNNMTIDLNVSSTSTLSAS